MKLLSLLSACVAVAFCTLAALPATSVAAFAQEAVAVSPLPKAAAGSFWADALLVVTVMAAASVLAALFVLVVRSDRNRIDPIEPEEALYHDPWRLPDRC